MMIKHFVSLYSLFNSRNKKNVRYIQKEIRERKITI